jgi:hypothetical protein
MGKDARTWPVGGLVQADTPGVARDHRCKLEQLHAQLIDLGRGQRGSL